MFFDAFLRVSMGMPRGKKNESRAPENLSSDESAELTTHRKKEVRRNAVSGFVSELGGRPVPSHLMNPPDTSNIEDEGGDPPDLDTLQDEGEARAIQNITGEEVSLFEDREGQEGGEGAQEDENADVISSIEDSSDESGVLVAAAFDAELLPDSPQSEEEMPLTAEERERFVTLERQVEESFLTAARALREINERRLYRESYPTFEDYIRDRFDFTKRLAYYYIDAANIADNLSRSELKVHVMPTSETQLRPLKNLPPEQQRIVWGKSVERADGKAPSGALVRQTKEELFPPEGNGKVSPPRFEEGDVCVVRGTTNELLTDRRGYWAVIDEVTSDGTVTLSLYDREKIDTVSPSELSPLPFKGKEKRDRRKLLSRLHMIDEGLRNDDRGVVLLMRHFGTLKAPFLTPMEEDILRLLERQARKSSSGEEISEVAMPES
jgi:hypothetical protein